jgi:hypothetical protein
VKKNEDRQASSRLLSQKRERPTGGKKRGNEFKDLGDRDKKDEKGNTK